MDSAFPDPTGWRKRAIDPEKWNDRAKVAELASNVPIDRQPVTALVNFANHMVMAEQDPVPFLLKVLAAHPDDYWVNMAMGNAMLGRGDAFNAARYYQASQALRPGTPWAHNGLGVVFLRSDKLDQAIPEFRAAVVLCDVEGLSYEEIGATLGVKLGTVRSRIHRGRQALKAALERRRANAEKEAG